MKKTTTFAVTFPEFLALTNAKVREFKNEDGTVDPSKTVLKFYRHYGEIKAPAAHVKGTFVLNASETIAGKVYDIVVVPTTEFNAISEMTETYTVTETEERDLSKPAPTESTESAEESGDDFEETDEDTDFN
jgi:hypothetical protein